MFLMRVPLATSSLILAGFQPIEILQTLIVALIVGSVGVVSTLAVLRWRTEQTEEKNKDQTNEQKKISEALAELTAAVRVQSTEVKNEIHESEKRTDQKLNDLSRTISRKIEGLREIQAEHGTKIAVLENDYKHTIDRIESHAQKIRRLTG